MERQGAVCVGTLFNVSDEVVCCFGTEIHNVHEAGNEHHDEEAEDGQQGLAVATTGPSRPEEQNHGAALPTMYVLLVTMSRQAR